MRCVREETVVAAHIRFLGYRIEQKKKKSRRDRFVLLSFQMSSMQKNQQHLVRPCAVFLERLNDSFIPSKRHKVDADIIYRPSNEPSAAAASAGNNEELSVDVLMLPNNKVKISSSSTFDDMLPTSTSQQSTNDEIKPVVRIRPHQSSVDSDDYEASTTNKPRSNSLRRVESSSSNRYDSDSYLFNGTFDSDDELGMDLNDDDLASINHVLDFDDDDMSNFDDDNPHLSSAANGGQGPGYHSTHLPDLVMGSIRSENGVKSEPSFQYSDLFNRKGRTFVCDERGNRVVSVKLEKNSAKRLIDAIERNLGRLVLEECRRGDLQAHILKVRSRGCVRVCDERVSFRLFSKTNRRSSISIARRSYPSIRLSNVQRCTRDFSRVSSNHKRTPMNTRTIRSDPT